MDYADGSDLRAWAGKHPDATRERRLDIIAQAAEALQVSHEAGVLHRDLKPSNLLVCGEEARVLLSDFGIGQVVSEEIVRGITRLGFTETLLGSTSGGSQLYLPPEVLAGKPATTRSDLFSLGVVCYQFLTGDFSRPLTTDWASDIDDPLLREDLARCFAGKPEERFGSAGELAQRFRQLPERRLAQQKAEAEIAEKERLAYRRGALKTASITVALTLIFAALSAYAFIKYREAKRQSVSLQRALDGARSITMDLLFAMFKDRSYRENATNRMGKPIRVIATDPKYRWAVVELGSQQGVRYQDSFILRRDGRDLLQVKALNIGQNLTICQIPDQPDVDIFEGDEALLVRSSR
jgi:eukaryotic-like serine/threonine-protein kinase